MENIYENFSVGAMWTFERTIDFRGKHQGFDFDFLAPKIWTVYRPN